MQVTMTDNKEKQATLSINANGTFSITYAAGAITVDLGQSQAQHFWKHLSTMTTFWFRDTKGHRVEVKPVLDEDARVLTFPLPKDMDHSKPVQLVMNHQPISEFTVEASGQLAPTARHPFYQLVVSETRGFAHDLNPPTLLPYDRKARLGFERDQHGSVTDLHTHSTSQVRAADVMNSALELDREANHEKDPKKAVQLYVTYPVELLTRLGVPPKPNQKIHPSPSYEFKPMQYEGLECEQGKANKDDKPTHQAIRISDLTKSQRDAVIRAMDAEEDITKTFQNVERENYRHFNPLMKNPRLTRRVLRNMAQDYAARGIEYAEVATSSLLDANWFEAMVREVDAIENGTFDANGTRNHDAVTVGPDHKPFHMRFLVGLPRKTSPSATLENLEKVKHLARHPYVIGVDIMGNETNKTSDFHWALGNIASWARKSEASGLSRKEGWNFADDFIIRVHAGETAKNKRNVGDVIRSAHHHQVRMRIGHAQNADLDETEKMMAKFMRDYDGKPNKSGQETYPKDWLGIEVCPDSNVFYRMRSLSHQVNLVKNFQLAHTTMGEDGNGMVHTDPVQQAFSAIAAGMTLDQLREMRLYEEGYIQRQLARDVSKTVAYDRFYPKGLDQFMAEYRAFDPKAVIAKRFAGKQEIIIGGANGSTPGSSWAQLDKDEQAETEQMAKLMVHVLDPEKVCFVFGRGKGGGAEKAFDIAIMEHNLRHPTEQFAVRWRYAGASEKEPAGELPESVSGIEIIPGGADAVVDATVDYARRQDAKCLFFGGAQFTSEIIQGINDVDVGQVRWAAYLPKKSEVRARVQDITAPHHHIAGARDLLENILCNVGEHAWFKSKAERDGMLRAKVKIESQEYREDLLEKVYSEWKHAPHVQQRRERRSMLPELQSRAGRGA